jgi:hypothetical protein
VDLQQGLTSGRLLPCDGDDRPKPRPTFDQIKADGPLSLDMDEATHLRCWRDLLGEQMYNVAALARSGMLPDVDLSGGTLKISPLRARTPPEADVLQRQAHHALPRYPRRRFVRCQMWTTDNRPEVSQLRDPGDAQAFA